MVWYELDTDWDNEAHLDDYVQKLLSSSQNEAAKELGKATVRYNEAANSYFP